jgi:HSP20 family protein
MKGNAMNLSLWNKRPTASLFASNGEIARLREEMDRTIDRFFNEPFGLGVAEPKSLRSEGWAPAIDVSENDTEVTIRAEAPGIPAKDFDISVSGKTLTIAGQKDESSEKKEENFYHCERRFGSFRRSIELPDSVDADKVTAESDNGVVTIRVAKKPGAKAKQVEVKPVAKKVPVG